MRSNYDLLILCVFILFVNSKIMSHGSLVVNCFLFCVCQQRPIKHNIFVGKAISVSPHLRGFTQHWHPSSTHEKYTRATTIAGLSMTFWSWNCHLYLKMKLGFSSFKDINTNTCEPSDYILVLERHMQE